MTALSPALDAALSADRALVTLLIEGVLPDYTLRLLAGSGVVAWGDRVFAGEDSRFGSLAAIDAIEDGDGDQAPSFGFTMFPSSAAASGLLCSATHQGSPASAWLAAVVPSTGAVIADPYLLFSGFLDQSTLKVGKGSRDVAFQCVSQFDLLLEDDEGARLSDAFHQGIWPGEAGFANVTGIEKTIYWGVAVPQGTAVTVGGYAGDRMLEAMP